MKISEQGWFWIRRAVWIAAPLVFVLGFAFIGQVARAAPGLVFSITPWEADGKGRWKAYLTDVQVSIVRMTISPFSVTFSVEQRCHESDAKREMTVGTWSAGNKRGKILKCDGAEGEYVVPPELETVLRSNVPEEVEAVFRKIQVLHRA